MLIERHFSLLSAALLFLVSSIALASDAMAERRVALVLGNGKYTNAVALPNASADASALADLLKSMGFEVVLGTDVGRDDMTRKLGEFASRAGGADVALFFYAGHGIQLEGKNLLIPIDADLRSELDAKIKTIEVDSVLQHTMADAKVKLVLLDACRDNPFAKQIQSSAPRTRSVAVGTGLAEMRPGEGALIAFATGPGQVALDGDGAHSPFTRALLTHLPEPDLEIRHVLTRVRAQVAEDTRRQQLPWENTNMTGFFYMKKTAAIQPGAAPATPATAGASGPSAQAEQRVMLEVELWNAVKTSTSPDEYRAYLEKFPNGTFADLARTRVASLTRSTTTAAAPTQQAATGPGASGDAGDVKTAQANEATEDALGLERSNWREIQTQLTGLGFSTRGSDGRVGQGTRKAISKWQAVRKYPESGYLNRLQRDALMAEKVTRQASAAEDDEDDTPAPARTRRYDRPQAERPSNQSTGSFSSPGSAAAGEFVGGVVRGVIGRRLPF